MEGASKPICLVASLPLASDVARGVGRLFYRRDSFAIGEVSLPNGRRADMMAVDPKGNLAIVEIKVTRSDLIGDCKWRDYLDYCDLFFWAVPAELAAILEEDHYLPSEAGLIVADRYDAVLVRDALHRPLAPARRKAELLRFARRAARRICEQLDPNLGTVG